MPGSGHICSERRSPCTAVTASGTISPFPIAQGRSSVSQHIAKPRTTAVVLAGGTGQRVGLSIPKQLLKIAGKAVIEHTLTTFEKADSIDDVIVLMAPGYVPDVEKIVAKAGFKKVKKIIEGGSTRNET